MSANDKQVGGEHYKNEGEQHWDRIYRLYGRGYFVGCATKYIERYDKKNGKQDLEKAIHFIEKLIELEYPLKEHTTVPEAQMAIQAMISSPETLLNGGSQSKEDELPPITFKVSTISTDDHSHLRQFPYKEVSSAISPMLEKALADYQETNPQSKGYVCQD